MARLSAAFKCGTIRLQRHLPREPLMVVFQTAKLRRGVQMFRAIRSSATIARLPRFYNKFCLQSDRSTTNAERAADRKLARVRRRQAPHRAAAGCIRASVRIER